MDVTALDIVPPVVVKVETQRTWDATENWAKVTAQDDNSGVVAIGWERAEKDMGSRHAPDPVSYTHLAGGAYSMKTGIIKKIDEYGNGVKREDGTEIPIEDIMEINDELHIM